MMQMSPSASLSFPNTCSLKTMSEYDTYRSPSPSFQCGVDLVKLSNTSVAW